MKRLLLILSVMIFVAGTLRSQDVQNMQAKNRKLQEEIAMLQERIQTTSDDIKGRLHQYRLAQRLLSNRQELIRGMRKNWKHSIRIFWKKTGRLASLKKKGKR